MNNTLGGITHAILRVGTALLFIEHGLQKVFGVMGGFGSPGGTAELMSRFGFAGSTKMPEMNLRMSPRCSGLPSSRSASRSCVFAAGSSSLEKSTACEGIGPCC